MDNKMLLAIILSLGIWVTWQKFYLTPIQEAAQKQREQQEQAQAEKKAGTPEIKLEAAPSKKAAITVATRETKTLVTETYTIKASNGPSLMEGGEFKVLLKDVKGLDENVTLEELAGSGRQLRLRFNEAPYQALNENSWQFLSRPEGEVAAVLQTAEVQVERSIKAASARYTFDVNYRLKFTSTPPKHIFLDFFGSPKRPNDKEGSIFGQAPDKVSFAYRDKNERHTVFAFDLKERHETNSGVYWFGLNTHYFLFAVAPAAETKDGLGVQIAPTLDTALVRGSIVVDTQGRKELNIPLRIYFGPKQLELLAAASPVLSDAVDFGWTSAIAIPILKALKWLYSFIGNYGIAIIILTIVIKILLFPLTYKSMKSMAKMTKLQPLLNQLREKYKDDKEKLNQEMLSFMKTQGYNPVGGCLPILIQMPIFFALYRVLFNSMELYRAPFGLWIHDLSARDPWFITPVILAAVMYVQQKLTPNTSMDPAQQKVLQLMPVMFGVFMLMLPAGLNIYMLVNSVFSVIQQKYLNKKFGVGAHAKA